MNKFINFSKNLLSGNFDKSSVKELCDTEEMSQHLKEQWEEFRYSDIPDIIGAEIFENVKKEIGFVHLKRKKKAHFVWISVAAAIGLIVGTGCWFSVFNTAKYDMFLAESDRTIILPDSSSVFLRSGSSIKYKKAFLKNREIELHGEAIFNVKQNPLSVFRVNIGNAAVQVKGTVFQVKHREWVNDEICLFEGCVEFKMMETDQRIIMKPGQKLIFDKLTSEVEIEQFSFIDWRGGKFFFEKVCLSDLISGINLIFGSDIKIGFLCDKISFTGSIHPHESLEDVIEKICFVLNLKYDDTSRMIMKKTD